MAQWEEHLLIVEELLESWDSAELDHLPNDVDGQAFLASFSWAQHCHHVAKLYVKLLDETETWGLAAPLLRYCFELAVKAQWISKTPGALNSSVWETEQNRRKLAKSFTDSVKSLGSDGSKLNVSDESFQDLIGGKMDQPQTVWRNFLQICQVFENSAVLYLLYRVLSDACHPGPDIIHSYMVLGPDGHIQDLNSDPTPSAEEYYDLCMRTLGQCLLWAQSALFHHIPQSAQWTRIRDFARRLELFYTIPLKGTLDAC